ncbi:MAG: ParM/StbA family protein [Georgfuchsia sp.]
MSDGKQLGNKVIGLDIGHSSVKVSAKTEHGAPVKMMFPSLVCRAFTIADEAEQQRADLETVEIDQRRYFFGDTAKTQGGKSVTMGLTEDWIQTQEHVVLLLGAMKKLASRGVSTERPVLVLGLPTHLYTRQKHQLIDIVKAHLDVADLFVVPQPMGPYQCQILEQNGKSNKSRNMAQESWGVVEVGHFTTDFMLVQNGRWVEKASGSCSGISVATDHLVRLLEKHGITISLLEAEEAMVTKTIRNFGKTLEVAADVGKAADIVVAEVVDTASRLLDGYARKMDGVIIAGGGASVVFDRITRKWPHAVQAENPRFSVAEGMRRLGVRLATL